MCWLASSSWRLFLADLAEQARVLNGEHRLRGERLQELDRALGKFAGRPAAHHQGADDLVGPEQDAVPSTARVTVLVNPKSAIGPPGQRTTEDAAKLLGLALTPLAVSNPDELRALEPAVLTGSDGLTDVNDAMF